MRAPAPKDAKRIGVYGRSGSGKSTLVKELLRGRSRAVVFDPMDEYGGAGRGYTRCQSLRAVLAGLKAKWAGGFRLAYVPPAGNEPVALHALATLLIAAQHPYKAGRDTRKITFVIEELNLSFPIALLPAKLNGMPELCSRGRHSGLELIGVSQRVAEVSTRFRGNTDEAFFFAQADHTSIGTITAMIGPGYREQLKALQTHQYLHFAAGEVRSGRNTLRR